MNSAQQVLLISYQKCGTHLVAKVLDLLGYGLMGMVRDDRTPPRLGRIKGGSHAKQVADAARCRAADLVLGRPRALAYRALKKLGLKTNMEDYAMDLLALSMAQRLGLPIKSRFSLAAENALQCKKRRSDLAQVSWEDYPRQLCWVQHSLDLAQVDGTFIKEWNNTDNPKIILNYRDPRDVLVSFVHYLTNRTRRQELGRFAEYMVYQPILTALPNDEARYLYALSDESFPGKQEFETNLWLLNHPKVCKVNFEQLVGESGGGSREAQLAALQRITLQLGQATGDLEKLASQLYDPNSFTFRKGTIGQWKDAFSSKVKKAFNQRYRHILESYSYG